MFYAKLASVPSLFCAMYACTDSARISACSLALTPSTAAVTLVVRRPLWRSATDTTSKSSERQRFPFILQTQLLLVFLQHIWAVCIKQRISLGQIKVEQVRVPAERLHVFSNIFARTLAQTSRQNMHRFSRKIMSTTAPLINANLTEHVKYYYSYFLRFRSIFPIDVLSTFFEFCADLMFSRGVSHFFGFTDEISKLFSSRHL